MKIIIIKPEHEFTKEDQKRLKNINAVFYNKKIDVADIPELYNNDEEKILAVQPRFIKDEWNGLPMEKLKSIKNLKSICLASTAFGWVDIDKLKTMNIKVSNCPGKATNAVAEGAYFSMNALLRKIPLLIQNNWNDNRNLITGHEAINLKIGIVGMGRIGSRFAQICSSFGLEVIYWNRTNRKSKYKNVSLEELFKLSDVIFLSFATDESTKGFIDNNWIDLMKKDALLVSCIDTNIFDLNYIIKKVKSKKLGGLAFESNDYKTVDFKGNIWVVPDSYYYRTRQTLENESNILTETIISAYNNKQINVIN